MQNVSEYWKTVQRQQLLNETFVEISFDITDPDAVADASSEDNGSIYLANTEQILSEVDKNIVPYCTLEENLWLLDGSRRFIPDSDFGDNGYIGNVLSNADGGYSKTPTVNIKFSEVHEPVIPGITITWGTAYDEYPEVFRVVAYNGSTVVAERRVENNKSVMSVVELDIANYDLIRIEVLKWCLPYHRARISEIFVGVNKVYDKSNIMGYEHEIAVDPIGATTPINKMSFAMDNSTNQYDPNNVTGMSKYLMERQEMRVRYGVKLNDGTVEYIPAGVFYLSEWEAPQNGLEATFSARDLLEFMQKTYTKGLHHAEGISLYDLAMDVLAEADLPLNDDGTVKWTVDESLKDIYTVAPLPLCSIAECLQYIAQAARCIFYCDRNGHICIERISTEPSDYELSQFNMFSRPEISLQKPVKTIRTKVYNYFEETDVSQLFKGDVAITGTQEIYVAYSGMATNASATVANGLLVSAVYYSHGCYLTIMAEATVSITVVGKALKTSESEYVVETGEAEGETQSVNNPLISSTTIATDVSEWVNDWMRHRKIVSVGSWRADPRLDATDIVSAENKYSTENVRMTSVKYTYAGAFKGSGEGRVV